ncbi:MAG: BTAD domain-containing putative transcriptional regulator [Stackebrandtia sp.]
MRFFVLGSLAVDDGNREITVDSTKQRLLLAFLLSRSGRAVSMDTLADVLWEGDPPLSFDKALRWHIHRLRRSLGEPERVKWRKAGYLLQFDPDECDAHRFERLHVEGTSALESGDPASADRVLREALTLWRGDAYSGLTDRRELLNEADRLDELHLMALEESCQARLDLGRHHELIAEMARLVAENPLRERFRAQLMLALYRCGRQAEALQVYRNGREAMIEELGIEPGEQLRRLEHDILNAEPALNPPEVVHAGSGSVLGAGGRPPAELPAANRAFTGRALQVKLLTENLTGTDAGAVPIAVVSGAGGSGKSDLAVHVAHKVAAHFPDGQLYVDLHGATPNAKPLGPGEVLARFLRSLGVDSPTTVGEVDELAARFRSVVADRRLLVVCDDAHDVAQVRPLLPGGSGCAVVITSRRPLVSLDGASHLTLDALDEHDAVALLSGAVGRDRVDAEPEAVTRIAQLCGHLPLALCIVAARLNLHPSMTVGHLAEQLATEDQRLDELAVDDRAVRASLAVSYRDLLGSDSGSAAARVFRLWGLFEGSDVSVEVAATLADVEPAEAERLLDVLVDARLADNHAPGRYRMHDLVRLYARERARTEEPAFARTSAVTRVMHCYLATVRSAGRLLEPAIGWRNELEPQELSREPIPLRDMEAASGWLEAEYGNLEAVTRQASRSSGEGPALAVAFAVAAHSLLRVRGRWAQMLAVGVEALRAAEHIGDPYRQVVALADLGDTQRAMRRWEDALSSLGTALEIGRRHHVRSREPILMVEFGYLHAMLGEYDVAVKHLRQGLDLSREDGNLINQGAALTSLGITLMWQGRIDEAAQAHQEAFEIARRLDSLSHQAVSLGNLADVKRRAGQPEEAASMYTRAIEQLHDANLAGSTSEADKLWGLGEALYDLGRDTEARRNWNHAASILLDLSLIDAAESRQIHRDPLPKRPLAIRM